MLSLSGLRNALKQSDSIQIQLPDGSSIPSHFHITEAGVVTKHFIDCGGTIRKESSLTMQIWCSVDLHHRLTPAKFLKILDKAEPLLNGEDLLVEIEYQLNTIGKFNLEFDGSVFQLVPTETDCLAKDQCGFDAVSQKKSAEVTSGVCIAGDGCC